MSIELALASCAAALALAATALPNGSRPVVLEDFSPHYQSFGIAVAAGHPGLAVPVVGVSTYGVRDEETGEISYGFTFDWKHEYTTSTGVRGVVTERALEATSFVPTSAFVYYEGTRLFAIVAGVANNTNVIVERWTMAPPELVVREIGGEDLPTRIIPGAVAARRRLLHEALATQAPIRSVWPSIDPAAPNGFYALIETAPLPQRTYALEWIHSQGVSPQTVLSTTHDLPSFYTAYRRYRDTTTGELIGFSCGQHRPWQRNMRDLARAIRLLDTNADGIIDSVVEIRELE